VGTSGDHWHFKHASKPGKTTVQHPRKDIPAKTLRAIERQSGVRLLRKG
jgi:predicted RNA binding protein YcfA (HicA-like mRNA interferase family)